MYTLVIRVPLNKLDIPSDSGLESAGYDSKIEYIKDIIRLNPKLILRNAELEIEEE